MKPRLDLSLYLVTDPAMTADRGLLATVAAAIDGGVTAVQFRQKDGPPERMIETGRALKALLAPRGVPLIVNDRIDVARAIAADGIHVGQGDASPEVARAALGPHAIIGLSITTEDQADAVSAAVDYVGLGPLFPTGTKPDASPALGEARFAAIRARVRCPVVAIGGITAANAGCAIAAGADGVAVVSAICAAADPRSAAKDLLAAVGACLEARARAR